MIRIVPVRLVRRRTTGHRWRGAMFDSNVAKWNQTYSEANGSNGRFLMTNQTVTTTSAIIADHR